MKLIGLTGKAGSGKDTVADYLVAHHGFVKRGFADALYEEVAKAFNVEVAWLRDRTRKEVPQHELRLAVCSPPDFADGMIASQQPLRAIQVHDFLTAPRSPRWILQQWGTEYRRGQDREYWVKKLADFCWANRKNKRMGIVVPDVRFSNESDMIADYDGMLWHLDRPGLVSVIDHESEKGLKFAVGDVYIRNDGSIPDLHQRVRLLVESFYPSHVFEAA